MQEVDGGAYSAEFLSRDSRKAPALTAYGYIETLIALLSELSDGDILTHFDTGTDIYANLSHCIYLGVDYIFLELV